MTASASRWRLSLRAALLALLLVATLLGVFRLGFDFGLREGHTEGMSEAYKKWNDSRAYLHVYYVEDLLPDHSLDEIVVELEKAAAGTWDIDGRPGSISGFQTNSSIVVSQTLEQHRKLETRLRDLRRQRDARIRSEAAALPGG
jgi:hypothetical protein